MSRHPRLSCLLDATCTHSEKNGFIDFGCAHSDFAIDLTQSACPYLPGPIPGGQDGLLGNHPNPQPTSDFQKMYRKDHRFIRLEDIGTFAECDNPTHNHFTDIQGHPVGLKLSPEDFTAKGYAGVMGGHGTSAFQKYIQDAFGDTSGQSSDDGPANHTEGRSPFAYRGSGNVFMGAPDAIPPAGVPRQRISASMVQMLRICKKQEAEHKRRMRLKQRKEHKEQMRLKQKLQQLGLATGSLPSGVLPQEPDPEGAQDVVPVEDTLTLRAKDTAQQEPEPDPMRYTGRSTAATLVSSPKMDLVRGKDGAMVYCEFCFTIGEHSSRSCPVHR